MIPIFSEFNSFIHLFFGDFSLLSYSGICLHDSHEKINRLERLYAAHESPMNALLPKLQISMADNDQAD
jgi:hypothetical protein